MATRLSDRVRIAACGGPQEKAAWVFPRSGTTWAQQGKRLTGGSEANGDGRFGIDLALSSLVLSRTRW
jgi:hypothetical protein